MGGLVAQRPEQRGQPVARDGDGPAHPRELVRALDVRLQRLLAVRHRADVLQQRPDVVARGAPHGDQQVTEHEQGAEREHEGPVAARRQVGAATFECGDDSRARHVIG